MNLDWKLNRVSISGICCTMKRLACFLATRGGIVVVLYDDSVLMMIRFLKDDSVLVMILNKLYQSSASN